MHCQLDYVLMRDGINSEIYVTGTSKNLYSDNKSLILRKSIYDNNLVKTARNITYSMNSRICFPLNNIKFKNIFKIVKKHCHEI